MSFNPNENIEKIKHLVTSIDLSSIATLKNGKVKYKLEQSGCEGHGLYKDEQVAVQYAVLFPNSVFQMHKHTNEKEFLILIEGDLINQINGGDEKEYFETDVVEIKKGSEHKVTTKNGCKIIAITIPTSEGYPDA